MSATEAALISSMIALIVGFWFGGKSKVDCKTCDAKHGAIDKTLANMHERITEISKDIKTLIKEKSG